MKKDKKIKKVKKIKKLNKVVVPEPAPRSDWELHMDRDCEFDCPFCYDEREDYEEEEYEEDEEYLQ